MDQCKHCTVRGDIEKCADTPCGHHDNWYAVTLRDQIERLSIDVKFYRDKADSEHDKFAAVCEEMELVCNQMRNVQRLYKAEMNREVA